MLEPKPDPMIARDLVGYGEFPPNPAWPGGALIAVNFNLNVEGGGEASLFNGDPVSEGMLNDIGVSAYTGRRAPLVELAYRIREPPRRLARARYLPRLRLRSSVLGVARALEQNPELARAFVERGHEIVSHGYRWIDYDEVPEDVEREHISRAIDVFKTLPARSRGLDDRSAGPQHASSAGRGGVSLRPRFSLTNCLIGSMCRATHLVIPYSYETNDNRFNENSGFSTGDEFFTYMRDAFDILYREGERGAPKLLSIGLHDRLIGRPGRCTGLIRLLEYMRSIKGVWFCRGTDIARHWRGRFPAQAD